MSRRKAHAPPELRELTVLIEEAADRLAAHGAGQFSSDAAEPETWASLLAQCEMLLEKSADDAPTLRIIASLGPLDAATRQLVERQANVFVLDALPDIEPSRQTSEGRAVPEPDRQLAVRAALASLVGSHSRRGQRLVVLIDALQASTDLLTDWEQGDHGPALLGVCLICHPLRSYLLARHNGQLPGDRATLEDFSEKCLRFLDNLGHFPSISLEAMVEDRDAGLSNLCSALHLTPGVSFPGDVAAVLDPVAPGVLLHPDGTPATEAPLDTPAYLALCAGFGYAPDRLVVHDDDDTAVPPASAPPALALPPKRADRGVSLISTILPRLGAILEASGASRAPSFSLDLYGLVERIEDCLGHPDGSLEAIDAQVAALPPRDGALLQIACAAHFQASGDKLMAMGLLAEVEPMLGSDDRPVRLLVAEVLLSMGKAEMALETLNADAFAGPGALSPAAQTKLRSVLKRPVPSKSDEHGHSLLLAHLDAHPPPADGRRRVMIEVGTTRETVPGQGSTEKLAIRCAELGIDFVTVDMDPRNSMLARRMFRRAGHAFRAVTAKGEDFLAEWSGPIDYCFLDAYDFDHGMHSELRQSRYESFLGSRIADEACHLMHYQCATSLIEKLTPDGVICFDDTWTDESGAWTAKGKTAMPLLLENGFKVLEARNRAALVVRG